MTTIVHYKYLLNPRASQATHLGILPTHMKLSWVRTPCGSLKNELSTDKPGVLINPGYGGL